MVLSCELHILPCMELWQPSTVQVAYSHCIHNIHNNVLINLTAKLRNPNLLTASSLLLS